MTVWKSEKLNYALLKKEELPTRAPGSWQYLPGKRNVVSLRSASVMSIACVAKSLATLRLVVWINVATPADRPPKAFALSFVLCLFILVSFFYLSAKGI